MVITSLQYSLFSAPKGALALSLCLVLSSIAMSCQVQKSVNFNDLTAAADWKLQFEDPCTGNWQDNWFKDGLISSVQSSEQGMNLVAGPENRNDAHHTVLWTKLSFAGDIKIEYKYTRTDTQIINVNILYIQATGVGVEGRGKDISQWNTYREVPTMSKYYYNMDPLHISYAAFPMVNEDPTNDYIRIRKYPAEEKKFSETEILPAYFKTGLFLPFETYQITVIKTGSNLFFKVQGQDTEKLFSWDLEKEQSPQEGRIGLRHMFTRSARYRDFKVFTR
ncbi:MAG: YesU family protein [Saprospiraceae bacterium]|nr:YesU family protein [Saprospiraceae bacterium]